MAEYIKKEDAVSVALRQPFFQNSMATEMRQIKGIDIVRCKECKHWDTADGECYAEKGGLYFPKADCFCSYGERREP